MKKHKSHARHVFNFLEKKYNIQVQFADDDDKRSNKKGGTADRRSTATVNKPTRGSDLIGDSSQ